VIEGNPKPIPISFFPLTVSPEPLLEVDSASFRDSVGDGGKRGFVDDGELPVVESGDSRRLAGTS